MEYISKDDLWKGAIEDCIIPFIHYFYKEYIHLIDWSKKIEFLDTELNNIIRGISRGKRTADKLVKVYLLNGEEKWFLIHVEVQSQADNTLNSRMYTMYYRLRDKYKVDVAPMAILAYGKAKNIGIYKENFWGSSLIFKYKTYNIMEEVEKGNIDYNNIFSLVIQAVYVDMKYTENNEEKYKQKLKLLEKFFGRKSSAKEYGQLLNFISIFIRLSNNYTEEISNFINIKTNSKGMGLKELFDKTIEKVAKDKDRIIEKKSRALLKEREALLKKDEALLKKDEALLKKDEATAVNAYKNGISIPLIVNITGLTTKEVKAFLKQNGLI